MTEPGLWKTRAEFETWWKANVIELNRLAVKDPPEYQRLATKISDLLVKIPAR